MKISKYLILLSFIIGFFCIWQTFETKVFSQIKENSAGDKRNSAKNFIADEIIIKYKSIYSRNSLSAVHSQNGAILKQEIPDLKIQHLKLPKGLSVDEAIQIYKQDPNVVYAQPNFIYHLSVTPDDTRYSELYGLPKINAPTAWNTTTGSSNVVVAVIDTGIDFTHEDLAANMWTNSGEINGNGIDDDGNGFIDDYYGYDFFFNDSNPDDEHGHGTHVAGTIGAAGNNSKGVVGVNWNVRLMAIKIYNSSGFGTTSVMLINAYNYVRLMKERGVNIRVTNNSYGGCDEACGYDQATKDALDALGNADVLNVFAAGNDARNIDTTPAYPASYTSPSILSVASSTSTDAKSGFSNFGVTSVDVAAPGSSILSTVVGNGYGYKSGTSMASPHTAGAVALLAAQYPTLSAASLKATIMNTVDVLPQWNNLVLTNGRINVANAIAQPTTCTFIPSETSKDFPKVGGSGSLNVTVSTNCTYAAFADQTWVQVTSNPGNGNGTITYTIPQNDTGANRSATLKIGDQTYTINQSGFDPTAANVTVAGRVLSSNGRGISRAVVSIMDTNGNIRRTLTNVFGYYHFDEIAVGETYFLNVSSKRYNFSQQTITMYENLSNLNFVANRNKQVIGLR